MLNRFDIAEITPPPVIELVILVIVLDRFPHFLGNFRAGPMSLMKTQEGVLGIRVVGDARDIELRVASFHVGPAVQLLAVHDSGVDKPLHVALDQGEVHGFSGGGENHRLQADDIGVPRINGAQEFQTSFDDRIVGLNAGIEKGQHNEAGLSARAHRGQAPVEFPITVVIFLVAQKLNAPLDGPAHAIHQRSGVVIGRLDRRRNAEREAAQTDSARSQKLPSSLRKKEILRGKPGFHGNAPNQTLPRTHCPPFPNPGQDLTSSRQQCEIACGFAFAWVPCFRR